MNRCAVEWCLGTPRNRRHVCDLHAAHPLLHSGERPDDYMARLRRMGVGEKRVRFVALDQQPLIGDDVPAEADVLQPGGRR
jgi:hypothetical protein